MERIKISINKLYVSILTSMLLIVLNTINAYAANPTFDANAAKGAISGYITPLMDLMLWLVPTIFGISALVSGLKWLGMDEQEREQKPYLKTLKKQAMVAVIIWSIPLITSIIGLK